MEESKKRHRNFCYTLNNHSENEMKDLQNIECKYHIIGFEIGEEEETEHLQGFITLKNAKTWEQMKNFLGNERIHLEVAMGSPYQNFEYCSKQDDYWENDINMRPKGQGTRSDLKKVAEAIKNGASEENIMEDFGEIYMKYHNGIGKMINMKSKNRNEKPSVYWFWGRTGCGKTRKAVEIGEEAGGYYIKDPSTKWWNNYRQDPVIILDDFDAWENGIGFRNLLRLLDRYRMDVETKGGYVKINSDVIIITSDSPPEKFWEGKKLEQIRRRIDKVICMGKRGKTGMGTEEKHGCMNCGNIFCECSGELGDFSP